MENRIKTQNYIIFSGEILSITLLKDKEGEFYGINILFKYGSSLRICNKIEALQILNIFNAEITD